MLRKFDPVPMIRQVPGMRRSALAVPVFVLLLAAAAGPARAQDDGDKVRAEILTIGWEGVIEDLKFESDDKEMSLDVYSRGFAPPVKYHGKPVIVFYRPGPPPAPDEPPERIVVGSVALPAGAAKVLLFFRKDTGKTEETYRIIAMRNDLRALPDGGFRFVNFTRGTVIGDVGKRRLSVESGKTGVVVPRGDENGNFEIRLGTNSAAEAKILYSSVWAANPRRRSTVFLLPSESRIAGLEVRKFVENFIPPPPEPE